MRLILNDLFEHISQIFRDISSAQNLLTLFVDNGALLIHDIIVAEDLLTRIEVAGFQLLLGVLDGVGERLGLQRQIVLYTQRFHKVLDTFTAKDAQKIVFQTQEKPGCTGIALTPCTATQLVVDAACFMAFGADNIQATDVAYLLPFRHDTGLVFGEQLRIPPTCFQNLRIQSIGMSIGFYDKFLNTSRIFHGCL